MSPDAPVELPPIFWAPVVAEAEPQIPPSPPPGSNGSKVPDDVARVRNRIDLGPIPVVSLTTAIGLAVCAVADARSRSTTSSSQYLFWVALSIIVAPIVWALLVRSTGRNARLVLVVMLGLALYLVKAMHSPFGFTFADELVHAGNVEHILKSHHLFTANSLLPITPRYPGLESVTAALSSLSGMGTFASGVVVIGAARFVLMLALFLLFERVTGSPRIASLGAAFYVANSNFVFFDGQFSYESLALPLLVVVLVCLAEQERHHLGRDAGNRSPDPSRSERVAWGAMTLLVTLAIVMTHHLSSYALVIVLVAVAALTQFLWHERRLWVYAAFGIAAVLFWFVAAGSTTVGYLKPVFVGAFRDTFRTISGEVSPRRLFESTSSTYQTALLERVVGIGSVILIAAVWPYGALTVWRRYRRNAFALTLLLASGGFFVMLALRFAPAAWETASRSSEFLYLGVAMVLAIAAHRFLRSHPSRPVVALVGVAFVLIFAGGVIAGTRPDSRLSQALRIRAGGRVLEPQGTAFSQWTSQALGPGKRFAASETDARLLVAYANQYAIAGDHPDVRDILRSPGLESWQLPLLRANRLRYVVVDRRQQSFDTVTGPYFSVDGQASQLLPAAIVDKFEAAGFDRLYDDGTIVLFDIGRHGQAPKR